MALVGALALHGQTQSVIQGTFVDAVDGSPVTGLPVVAVGTGPLASPSLPVYRTISGDGGAFTLAVPAGGYRLCVGEERRYVDPCQWYPGSTNVSAPSSLPVVISLARGVRIVVHVADPGAKLAGLASRSTALAGVTAPPVSVSIVDSTGAARLVPFQGAYPSGYDFSLPVPATGQFTLVAGSQYMSLADEAGVPLAGNQYSAVLNQSAILSAWASAPSWLPLWLSPRGLPSKTIGLTVYALLQ